MVGALQRDLHVQISAELTRSGVQQMADPSFFDPVRIPFEYLTALDNRDFHFTFQRWHFVARMVHVITVAWFFGGIALLDLQLIGLRARSAARRVFWRGFSPCSTAASRLAMASGLLLFFYDPVHVGAHAYFAPKLILIFAGLLNALFYHRMGLDRALRDDLRRPGATRFAGLVSLMIWSGVMIFAALNVEGVPKVFLR